MLYELINNNRNIISLSEKELDILIDELKNTNDSKLISKIINLYNIEIDLIIKRINYIRNKEYNLFLIKSKEKRVKELKEILKIIKNINN